MGGERLGRKQLWTVIAALILINCLTLAFFLSKANLAGGAEDQETVATVRGKTIERKEWLNELEARYGKDVLKDMVDQKVIEEMAAKYRIKISNLDVEREFRMLKATYNSFGKQNLKNEKRLKEQIRTNLLLEELLTKDAKVSNDELESYYQKNKDLFNVPAAYHLSHIVVGTKEEADQTRQELGEGSNFSTLAMERSIDEFSANEGGDIGYISEQDERYPLEYIQIAKELKTGAYSQPINVEQGFAILKLEGKITGRNYAFKDVKEAIRRQMALEKMNIPVSAAPFWDDAKVHWVYGK
jgi:foldase protein PrsA